MGHESTDKMRRQVGPTSLADLKRGMGTPGDSGASAVRPPPWLNREVYDPKFISQFFNKNVFFFTLALAGQLLSITTLRNRRDFQLADYHDLQLNEISPLVQKANCVAC